MTLGEVAVKRAKQSIGVYEKPANWGKWVKTYLAFVGIFCPAPWCAAFVAFKVHQASRDLGISVMWPKWGYVQKVVNWAVRRNLLTDEPGPACAFVVYNDDLKRYAHIGFIVEVSSDGKSIKTVEGNSNTDGGREGTSVVSMWRAWTSRHKCIKIV